jgi:hypothetical protein
MSRCVPKAQMEENATNYYEKTSICLFTFFDKFLTQKKEGYNHANCILFYILSVFKYSENPVSDYGFGPQTLCL